MTFIVIILIISLIIQCLVLKKKSIALKKLATKDALTGISNRLAFENETKKYVDTHKESPFVAMVIDIDDFKCINDIYGHAYGDHVLKIASTRLENFFDDGAIVGRVGGDEFKILVKNSTCEKVEQKIRFLVEQEKVIVYNDKDRCFNISIGYAQYPDDADTLDEVFACADLALYNVKLRRKEKCKRFDKGMSSKRRTQLGFKLRDISDNLPGMLLVWLADKENDEVLFVNKEMVDFTKCDDVEDFYEFTHKKFSNLLKEDEYELMEKNILNRAEADDDGEVNICIRKKDGTYGRVSYRSRMVQNAYFGNIIFSLITEID